MPNFVRKASASAILLGVIGCQVVDVTSPDIATISLSSSATSVAVGGTVTIDATLKDNLNRDLDRTINWSADGPQVQVTGSGRSVTVRGVSVGTTSVRAESEGVTQSLSLTVVNAAATVTSVAPAAATVGAAAFTLTVTGRDFVSGAVVVWNNQDRNTTFVSATQVTAAIPASDLAAVGTFNVSVRNPAPGGGSSGTVQFTVNNPTPVITSVSPATVAVGSPAFTLTVTGTSFVNNAVVRWNGANRTTTFVNSTTLTAAIPATDLVAAGTAAVTVANPAPVAAPSNAVNVTITVGAPDLVITALTTAASGTVGGTLQTSATVLNQGTSAAAPFRLGFYLSTDATITTADVFTETGCNFPSGLSATAQNNCSGEVEIPSTIPPGTYYLGAITDDLLQVAESNENNNTRASTAVTIAVPADLTIAALTAPASGTIGGAFPAGSVSVTVRNQGTAASGAFRVGLYFSTDATITTTDVRSNTTCTYPSGLAAGASNVCGPGISVVIPATLTAGTYYLGAIADDQAAVAELSETNNTRATAGTISLTVPPVDLVVTALTAASTATVGGNIQVSVTVLNQGSVASGPSRVGLYLSPNSTISLTDVYLNRFCALDSGLAAGTQTSCSGLVPIPASTTPGTYYIGGIADDEEVVAETNENNNTRASAAVTITSMELNEAVAERKVTGSLSTKASPSDRPLSREPEGVPGEAATAPPLAVIRMRATP
jgi:subtilase family serine protease